MGIEIDKIFVNLLPSTNIFPTVTLVDILKPGKDKNSFYFILSNKYNSNWSTTYNPAGKLNATDYRPYLQLGNLQIKELVRTIVTPTDTNDQKADKILKWVQNNIVYVSDIDQYHVPEYWAKPTETLTSGKGDCEDQAFLIQSMLLAAGIPANRIRTYGGLVKAGINAPLGGHAWTIYKRETDNQWVALDACYYPDNLSVAEKKAFKTQDNYVDAYWWMNTFGTYDEYGKWGIDIYV